ncbi:hypothetical protein [Streptomyces sp. E-08]|uniref:hypothetical protein n=1 Tax=Streptomyces sp. E-08 TaxID=3404047 RepID=UPI003CE6FA4D
MAMLETILATVSGLGGAGLGAAGALLVQRAKRRDDATATRTASEQAEQARTLETIATARVAARAWLTAAQYMAADLQNGRLEEARRYVDQLESAYGEFVSALYRVPAHRIPQSTTLPAVTIPRPWSPAEPASAPRPFADELAEVSQLFREAFHQRTQPQMQQADLDDLQAQARSIYQRVTMYMGQRTAELTGTAFDQLRMLEVSHRTSDSHPLDGLLRVLEDGLETGPELLTLFLTNLSNVMPPADFKRVETQIRRVQAEQPDLKSHEVLQIAYDTLIGDRQDTVLIPAAAKTESEAAVSTCDEQAADGPPSG